MTGDISPLPNTKVNFKAATAFVRDYKPCEKTISDVTSAHRGKAISLETGYILIDQAWGRRTQEKVKGLGKEEIADWKRDKKR